MKNTDYYDRMGCITTVDMQCAGMNIKKYRIENGMYVEDL